MYYDAAKNLAGINYSAVNTNNTSSTERAIEETFRKYQEDPENYSAPVIGAIYGTGIDENGNVYNKTHYVMVVGINEDGSYQIVDPSSCNATTYRYSHSLSDGQLSTGKDYVGRCTQVIQYYKG